MRLGDDKSNGIYLRSRTVPTVAERNGNHVHVLLDYHHTTMQTVTVRISRWGGARGARRRLVKGTVAYPQVAAAGAAQLLLVARRSRRIAGSTGGRVAHVVRQQVQRRIN